MQEYRHIFDAAPDGMLVVDYEGLIVQANAAALALFGYAAEELIGQQVDLLVPRRFGVHATHRDRYVSAPRTREMGGGLSLFGQRKDGREFPVDVMLSPLAHASRVLCVIRDISERQRIHDERARLAAIIESATDAIIGKDLDGTIQVWNPSAELLFGYTAAEAIGRDIAMLVPDELLEEEARIMQRIRAGERVEPYESVRRRKDGSLVEVGLTVSPVRDAKGQVVSASKIVNDLSHRRRMERQFRQLLESAPDAMVIADASGTIQLANSQAERLFGYAAAELIGQPVELLMPERFRGRHPNHRKDYAGAPRVRPMGSGLELFGQRKDGSEFPIELSLSPLETDSGMLVSSAIRDISERKRAEKLTLDSLHEKEMLLKEVHHRVKNNLAVIASLFYLQQRDLTDPGMIRVMQESQDRVRSMAMVHESLYNSDSMAEVDFADYADNLARQLIDSYSRDGHIRLTTALAPISMSINTAVPCGLILNEIVTNAVKHAFPDGRSGNIHLSLSQPDSRTCVLEVRDDGTGLPDDFDPAVGHSLGLHLIRSLSRQVDGVYEFLPASPGTLARLTLNVPPKKATTG